MGFSIQTKLDLQLPALAIALPSTECSGFNFLNGGKYEVSKKYRFHLRTQFQDRKWALVSFWRDRSSIHTLFRSLVLLCEVFQQIQLGHCYGRCKNFFLSRRGWEIKHHWGAIWHGIRQEWEDGYTTGIHCALCRDTSPAGPWEATCRFHVLSGKLI